MIVGFLRSTVTLPLALLALFATGLAGCETGALKKVEQNESIFAVFSPPTPAEALAAMVDQNDADRRFRGTAMIAYAPFGGESVYIRYYAEAVQNDSDPGVRSVSARALGFHGGPEHVPLILPLLDDNDRNVRHEAVRALQRLHNPIAIDPLIERTKQVNFASNEQTLTRLGEADSQIRADACTALGQYAEPRVIQALITAVDDDQLVVNRAAADSLTVLTGQTHGENTKAWLLWFSSTKEPFAGRGTYTYPVFARDKSWYEYIPLMPQPPNESTATPAGLPTPGMNGGPASSASPTPTPVHASAPADPSAQAPTGFQGPKAR